MLFLTQEERTEIRRDICGNFPTMPTSSKAGDGKPGIFCNSYYKTYVAGRPAELISAVSRRKLVICQFVSFIRE